MESREKKAAPAPEGRAAAKKEDPRAVQRRKVVLAALVMCIPFGLCMWLIFRPAPRSDPQAATGGINVTVPGGRGERIEQDKQKAAEIARRDEQESERMQTLGDDPFGLFGPKEEGREEASGVSRSVSTGSGRTGGTSAAERMRQSQLAHERMTRRMNSLAAEPRQDPEVERLRERLEAMEREMARAEDGTKDPMRYLEQSYALAQKYLTPQGAAQESVPLTEPEGKTPLAVRRAPQGIVSGLRAPGDTLRVGGDSVERNTGFHTAVGAQRELPANSIRACVDGEQVLTAGSPIKLRLCDGLIAGGVAIPAGAPLYGEVRLGGQRMGVEVTSIEYGGRIIPVQLTAYDLDGQPGLRIHDSRESSALKDAAANMSQSFGSSISLARTAGQQVAMDLARGAMTGGTQYIASKVREVKVSVRADYQLLLITKQ